MRGTTAKLLRRESKRLAKGDIAGARLWYRGTKRIWSKMSHIKRSEV